MRRRLRQLGTGAGFLSFAMGAAVMSWFLIPLLLWKGRKGTESERIRATQELLRGGYHVFMNMLRAYDVCAWKRPPPPERPDGAYVLIANHPSLLDVIALLAIVPNICCVVRRGLFNLPFLEPLLRLCGHITGPDSELDEGDTPILDRIVARLEQGFPVLIFPEGSRSPKGGLRRFRRGGVEAALRAGVPILPAFVMCEPSSLRKDQPWHDVADRAFDLTVDFLPVMNPPAGADSRELTKQLAAMFRERLDATTGGSSRVGEGR